MNMFLPVSVRQDPARCALEARAVRIRRLALEMVTRACASHIGSALSIADIVAALYGEVLRVDPTDPAWQARDRLLLSKGHACVIVYAALADAGFFPLDWLESFARDGSDLMSHISHKVPGVDFSAGSLGHGLPFGTGKALAAKKQRKDWRTFVILGDGEMAEGSNWEAMMFAAHHGLDNLVGIIDYNKLQSLTTVEQTLRIEPLADKIRAFGWSVREVDGHDIRAVSHELSTAPWEKGKPSMLIAHTVKGKGVRFMENEVAWHYRNPSEEQLALAIAELGDA